MQKAPEPDLSLIGPAPGAVAAGGDDDPLYAAELAVYSAYDAEDDLAYERRARNAFLQRELKQIDEMVQSRRSYANKIFLLVVGWLVALGAVLLLVGFHGWGFDLDNKVLLVLIGGTTLNVLGIFTIVASFLFPKGGHAVLSHRWGASPPEPGALAASKPRGARAVDNGARQA